MTIKDVLDLGSTGLLAIAVYALWQRLNLVTDRALENKLQGDAERRVIASQVGLDTLSLKNMARQLRDDDSRNNLPIQK